MDLCILTTAVDDGMAAICYRAVNHLKMLGSEDYLTWENVQNIFSKRNDVVKNKGSAKFIKGIQTSYVNCPQDNILKWFNTLLSKRSQEFVFENSTIIQKTTWNRTVKKKEVGFIRYPGHQNATIKLFHFVVDFGVIGGSHATPSIRFKVKCNSVEFRLNTVTK